MIEDMRVPTMADDWRTAPSVIIEAVKKINELTAQLNELIEERSDA